MVRAEDSGDLIIKAWEDTPLYKPVSLRLKSRDFLIDSDDPIIMDHVRALPQLGLEVWLVEYLPVWKLPLRELFKVIFVGPLKEPVEENLIILKIISRHIIDEGLRPRGVIKN